MWLSRHTTIGPLLLILLGLFYWFHPSLSFFVICLLVGLIPTVIDLLTSSRTTQTRSQLTNRINDHCTNNSISTELDTTPPIKQLRHRSTTGTGTTAVRPSQFVSHVSDDEAMHPSSSSSIPTATDADSVYTHTLLQSLLSQARVHLAQGHPSKALSCVLAAVRHQRGEEGVFQVLNETREAHGLTRLPVPPITQQIGEGSQPLRLPDANSAPSSSTPSATSGFHSWRNDGHQSTSSTMDENSMMIDDEQTLDSNDPVDPDLVTSLFRRLGVTQTSPTAASSSTSASAFTATSHTGPPMPQDFLRQPPTNSGYPSTASSRGVFHQGDEMNDDDFAALTADSHIIHGPAPPIHYPSLRTYLPALSGGTNSSTMLEEIHAPRMNHPPTTAALPSSSSSSSSTAIPAPDSATPILCSNGREDILHLAYDSETSVICYQCSALIPKARFEAHINYWCQATGD